MTRPPHSPASPSSRWPKQVGLNVLWLVPGVVGGSEEYTTRLLATLADLEVDDLAFTLFANRSFAAAYPDLMARFDHAVGPTSGRSKPVRVGVETTWLGAQCVRRRIELVHHLGGIVPAWRPCPTVLTIHDLQPLAMPRHFRIDKRWFNRFVIPRSVAAARDVVTLTAFTEHDLTDRLGVHPDRMILVPPGFDIPVAAGDASSRLYVRDRYGIGDRPFFLFPAITYPHKNHVTLLHAMALLRQSHPEATLVLTSGASQMEEQVRTLTCTLGIERHVVRTGRIPADDLDALYREATALTFPSLYEGFGLPVLEAMSRDCPVIAADATALPEVVQDAGWLIDPLDPSRWAEAMGRLLDDTAARTQLVEAGRARARHYEWRRSAEVLADVYRRGPRAVRQSR